MTGREKPEAGVPVKRALNSIKRGRLRLLPHQNSPSDSKETGLDIGVHLHRPASDAGTCWQAEVSKCLESVPDLYSGRSNCAGHIRSACRCKAAGQLENHRADPLCARRTWRIALPRRPAFPSES